MKQLVGTLFIGHDNIREIDCKVIQLDDIYKCEMHKPLSERTEEEEKNMKTDTELSNINYLIAFVITVIIFGVNVIYMNRIFSTCVFKMQR